MINGDNNSKENEEFSIIDLIIVIIRYRKMILIGTIISVFLAALYIFVIQPKKTTIIQPEEKNKVVYTVRLNYLSPVMTDQIARNCNRWWDFNNRILQDFVNPTIIGSLYEKNQFSEVCEEGDGENFINEYLQDQKITISPLMDTTYAITIKMTINSEEKLDNFMKSFINYELDLVQNKYIENNIELIEERYRRKLAEMDKYDPKTINYTDIQVCKDTLQEIEAYKKQNKPFYEIQGKPVYYKNNVQITSEPSVKEKVKKIIIIGLGAFVVFVLISFIVNTIYNIKKDPVISNKFKEAWDSGKIKKHNNS